MTVVPSTVLYYPQGDDAMVYEVTEYPYNYPKVQGVRVPQSSMRPSRISAGLLVKRIYHTTNTPVDLLRDTLVHLLHLEAPGCDGDLATYLLLTNHFPVDFQRPPYDSPIPSMNLSPLEDLSGV
jgi:hypothetical protein